MPTQQKIIQRIDNSNSFLNILTSPDLATIIETSQPDHRKRLYSPTETLSLLLAQTLNSDGSCQKVINDHSINKTLIESSTISVSTGAYCRARQRLPLSMACK